MYISSVEKLKECYNSIDNTTSLTFINNFTIPSYISDFVCLKTISFRSYRGQLTLPETFGNLTSLMYE